MPKRKPEFEYQPIIPEIHPSLLVGLFEAVIERAIFERQQLDRKLQAGLLIIERDADPVKPLDALRWLLTEGYRTACDWLEYGAGYENWLSWVLDGCRPARTAQVKNNLHESEDFDDNES